MEPSHLGLSGKPHVLIVMGQIPEFIPSIPGMGLAGGTRSAVSAPAHARGRLWSRAQRAVNCEPRGAWGYGFTLAVGHGAQEDWQVSRQRSGSPDTVLAPKRSLG